MVGAFSGGDGSPGNPYVITTVEHLQAMEDDLDAYYILGNDIDASETLTWNGGLGFAPIGQWEFWPFAFAGHFDGQGYVISNLYINRTGEDYVGLFGHITGGAEVKNVGLVDIDVTGRDNVGGLVGKCEASSTFNCLISDCYSMGNVSGRYLVGGFVGKNYLYSTITNCYSAGSVSGDDSVGGFVGKNDDFGVITNCHSSSGVRGDYAVGGFVGVDDFDTITSCYSTGSVNGSTTVGGFVGGNDGAISKCYSTGSVNSEGFVGGFAGQNGEETIWYGKITDCYSTGNVSGIQPVGGFVAVNDEGKIAHCYSNGSVNGVKFMGGFAGVNYLGDIILCYWDKDTSGMTWSDGGTGKTTDELKQQATFVIWDFADIWCIGEDVTYPHLRYMPEQVTASTTGSGNVFFDVEEPYALADLEAVDESNLPTAGKPDLRFPHGFFSFKIIGLTPGASATVTITFPSDIKTEYWKYHEPEGWIDVTSLMGSNDGDNILTLTITDGDLGDDDNEVNSIIVDQGGPGFPVKRVRTSSVVGGVLIPMNDLIILLPYFALISFACIISSILLKRDKHKNNH
ncbi:MAG: hypothetical protein NWF08_03400 [Candidatus Bathyarchaeota archaeon]|nr:hypothetical protein [Candidatus Bathyarchaeota archaeon]